MELWKTLAPFGTALVAALALIYQVRRFNHPVAGAYERAANALGLAKALSDLDIPLEDTTSRQKSQGLQRALLDQSFLATQRYVDRAAPVLTTHWQTLFFGLMIPVSFLILLWNAEGQAAGSAAFPIVIGAIFVVPTMFGIVTAFVYGRVVRYRATTRNLAAVAKGNPPTPVMDKQEPNMVPVPAIERVGSDLEESC